MQGFKNPHFYLLVCTILSNRFHASGSDFPIIYFNPTKKKILSHFKDSED
jgi:hypothetical protein